MGEADFPTPPDSSLGERSTSAHLRAGGSVFHVRLAWEARRWQQLPQKALPGCRMHWVMEQPPRHPWRPLGLLHARPRSQGQLSRRRHVRLSEKKRPFTSSEFFLHFFSLFPCFLLIRKCSWSHPAAPPALSPAQCPSQ